MKVIGLGRPGCAIASKFTNYPEYTVYCVDAQNDDYSGKYIEVEEQQTHEDYEDNYKPINLNTPEGPILFIFSGSGKISGISLRLLENF